MRFAILPFLLIYGLLVYADDGPANGLVASASVEVGGGGELHKIITLWLTITEVGSTIPTGSVVVPSASGLPVTTPIHVSSTPGSRVLPTATYSPPLVPTGNATYTSSPPSQFTGGAQKVAAGGMAVLAGAAGLVGLL